MKSIKALADAVVKATAPSTVGETTIRLNVDLRTVDRTVVGGFAMFFIGILGGLIGLVWGI